LIRRLGKAAEYRDNETGKHVIRVAHYSKILAEAIGLTPERVTLIFLTAPMHDVGKIGVPDEILKKKDRLKPIEYEVIKTHALLGGEVMKPMTREELSLYNAHMEIGAELLGESDTPILQLASLIALTHHEKWDGTGYPRGTKGTDIPIEGRIVALADVYDALSSKRYYKPAFPEDECVKIINEMRGTNFDPDLVDAFNSEHAKLVKVKEMFAETEKTIAEMPAKEA
jgi:putative two-component system response regulator